MASNITCDLAPYNCIQPPPIKHTLPVFIYIWEDVVGYSNTPPGESDRTLINEGCLHVLQVIGSHAYCYDYINNIFPVDQAVDYGDYHSTGVPF